MIFCIFWKFLLWCLFCDKSRIMRLCRHFKMITYFSFENHIANFYLNEQFFVQANTLKVTHISIGKMHVFPKNIQHFSWDACGRCET